MGMSSLLIIAEALKSLFANLNSPPTLNVDATTYAILGSTIVVKILLWAFCKYAMGKHDIGSESASVEAYAADHMLDCASNGVAIAALIVAG